MDTKEWLLSFRVRIDGVLETFSADVTREGAELFMRSWTEQNLSDAPGEPKWAHFCGKCPVGEDVDCPHDETFGQRGWLYTEITEVWIERLRAAV